MVEDRGAFIDGLGMNECILSHRFDFGNTCTNCLQQKLSAISTPLLRFIIKPLFYIHFFY